MADESSGHPRRGNLWLFVVLLAASVLSFAAQAPALLFLADPARSGPLADPSVKPVSFVIGFGIANLLFSAIAIAIGLLLEPSVRMGVPLLRYWLDACGAVPRPLSATLLRSSALATGLVAFLLTSAFVLRAQLPALPENFTFPPIWQGILMMLGAAVREEILFRFCALNLLTWLAMKVLRRPQPTASVVWSANILVAFIFAGLHLVPAAPLLDLNPVATAAAIALGTLAGTLLGWVYWRHGLLMAIYTHAIAGLGLYLGARALIALAS
jgi:hypothetical protein